MKRIIKTQAQCSPSILGVMKAVSLVILTVVLFIAVRRHFSAAETFNTDMDFDTILDTANIDFIEEKDFQQQLKMSVNYFSEMTSADLKARGDFNTPKAYFKHYMQSFTPFKKQEKELIVKATLKANALLVNYPRLRSIKWNFAKVDVDIEEGWPHTHNTMIVLTEKTLEKEQNDLVETLIHEKLHIYQRIYEPLVRDLYENMWLFKPAQTNLVHSYIAELARSNPDLGNRIFTYQNKFYIIQLFNSLSPKSISDSSPYAVFYDSPILQDKQALTNEMLGLPADIRCQLEHPNEIMACIVSYLIANPEYLQNNKDILTNNEKIRTLVEWMKENL